MCSFYLEALPFLSCPLLSSHLPCIPSQPVNIRFKECAGRPVSSLNHHIKTVGAAVLGKNKTPWITSTIILGHRICLQTQDMVGRSSATKNYKTYLVSKTIWEKLKEKWRKSQLTTQYALEVTVGLSKTSSRKWERIFWESRIKGGYKKFKVWHGDPRKFWGLEPISPQN